MTSIKQITCTIACNKLNSKRLPYNWDLNIYRGCQHGCKYCYALYSHDYLKSSAYFDEIYVKTNVVEQLEKQLSKSSWQHEVINIGGVTDSYQPIEKQYQLMPEILKLLIKYKNPCIISTKSDLILRDLDLIARLAQVTYVNIAATITCINEDIRQKLEPGGVDSLARFRVLQEIGQTKAITALHIMPIVPYLTDSKANLDNLYALAKKSGVNYVLPGLLNLRGKTKICFFEFIKTEYPKLLAPLLALYQGSGDYQAYKGQLYALISQLKVKHGLGSGYNQLMRQRLAKTENVQLSLF